jgi:hypothetical protein
MASDSEYLGSSVSGAWNSPSNATGAPAGSCSDSPPTEDGDASHVWRIDAFSIPAGTINGIEAEVEYSMKEDQLDIEISPDNSAYGTLKTLPELSHSQSCAAAEVRTVGSPTDLWGNTWTPGNINDGLFVRLTSREGAEGKEVYCDYVQITVYHTPSGGATPGKSVFFGTNF